jgi:hypothetical protein
MPFELDTPTLIAICAAISAVLFAEAVYLLGFSTASYRSNVNRRLKLSSNQPDREAILIQLRRERGLTKEGFFRFGVSWFNRHRSAYRRDRPAVRGAAVQAQAAPQQVRGAIPRRDGHHRALAAGWAPCSGRGRSCGAGVA